jgi:hypothetical protein
MRHLRLLAGQVGPEVATREMRKHVAWYVKGLPHSARVREQVNRTRTAGEMVILLRGYLGELERHGPEAFAQGAAPAASAAGSAIPEAPHAAG